MSKDSLYAGRASNSDPQLIQISLLYINEQSVQKKPKKTPEILHANIPGRNRETGRMHDLCVCVCVCVYLTPVQVQE